MAVYDRAYHRYAGPQTGRRWRFLAITRVAFQEVVASRLFLLVVAVGFVSPIAYMLLIYLRHNLSALAQLGVPADALQPINQGFLLSYLVSELFVTAVLALLVGPSLVAPDLKDNALPLYLSRPISAAEYLLGKALVLLALLSVLTWVTGLLLFAFQAVLEGTTWLGANWRLAVGVFVASWAWILPVTCVTLAVSAYVRRLTAARVTIIALFIVPSALGNAFDALLDTVWGGLLSPVDVLRSIWLGLFGLGPPSRPSGAAEGIPAWSAWAAVAVLCAVSLWLMRRQVRAFEVVTT
jgi:ABC-2 type transport system permease protein